MNKVHEIAAKIAFLTDLQVHLQNLEPGDFAFDINPGRDEAIAWIERHRLPGLELQLVHEAVKAVAHGDRLEVIPQI